MGRITERLKSLLPKQAHRCHAIKCTTEIKPAHLMCDHHWSMVSYSTRLEVSHHYRKGQEVDKQPSLEWMAAARNAIREVSMKEGHGDPNLAGQRVEPVFQRIRAFAVEHKDLDTYWINTQEECDTLLMELIAEVSRLAENAKTPKHREAYNFETGRMRGLLTVGKSRKYFEDDQYLDGAEAHVMFGLMIKCAPEFEDA